MLKKIDKKFAIKFAIYNDQIFLISSYFELEINIINILTYNFCIKLFVLKLLY